MEEPSNVFTNHLIKAVVVGDAGSGKTNFITHFVHANIPFKEQYRYSIGVDFATKNFTLDNQQGVLLQMWDIAGHNKVDNFNLHSVYFKNARIFIITISADQAEDAKLKQIDEWLQMIHTKRELPYRLRRGVRYDFTPSLTRKIHSPLATTIFNAAPILPPMLLHRKLAQHVRQMI